jgi:acetyltransferase-like isoleucine patch superfamily enzyme/dTDP-4-dehydrorhamnose 3,5-epimerase-like enzyme
MTVSAEGLPATVQPSALCESSSVGAGTAIGAFARIAPTATIGADTVIRENVVIEAGARVGSRVTIGAGSWIGPDAVVEDDVVLAANVTVLGIGEDGVSPGTPTIVRRGASIKAGSTIMDSITVGRGAVVEAGSVVLWPVPPFSVVAGNPAWTQRYLEAENLGRAEHMLLRGTGVSTLGVGASHVCRFPEFIDVRGGLTVSDLSDEYVPFEPVRFFTVYAAPSGSARGDHAHRRCHQFIMCVAGSVWVSVDDGEKRKELVLDSPTLGVYVPPMVWASQFRFQPDSVVMVFASLPYDPAEYIRDYEQFLAEVQR